MRFLLSILVLSFLKLTAGSPVVSENPMEAPIEMQLFVKQVTNRFPSTSTKAQGLLHAIFQPVSEGGLGMTYDNSYTRNVQETWRDRKANCLSLTAFFVAACKVVGIDATFAESPSVSQWRRVGGLVRHELHVVAVVRQPPLPELVADFLPEMRKGFYLVNFITENRARSLFYSNRAVELLENGDVSEAEAVVRKGIHEDPVCGPTWNILGVICQTRDNGAQAEQAFLQALRINPKDGAALGNLDSYYRSVGQYELAMQCRRMSMLARDQDPYFHAYLAKEAMGSGDLEKAVKYMEKAIKMQEREPEFYIQLSKIHLMRGKLADAEAALSKGQKYTDPSEHGRFESKLAKLKASA